MKATIKLLAFILAGSTIVTSCKKDDTPAAVDYYEQQDQMGRPAINTVFVTAAADKDAFNTTAPSAMNAAFQTKFQARLLALNSGYTTNALTQNAATFTGLLSTDVLNVTTSNTTPTTFFDGTNVLTGRNPGDDVINTELLLIFGGPTGASNPSLTNDHVDANDKAFLSTFPYLATPF
jgi:hypothetical protein